MLGHPNVPPSDANSERDFCAIRIGAECANLQHANYYGIILLNRKQALCNVFNTNYTYNCNSYLVKIMKVVISCM